MYKELRPKSFDEFIGQKDAVKRIKSIIDIVMCDECNGKGKVDNKTCKKCDGLGWKERPPDILFVGPPGVGKSTLAYIYANSINAKIVELNASEERGIQVVRENIKSQSKMRGRRIIFLDEADNLTTDAFWALRRIMETCARGVSFVLSCNYLDKIVQPIQDRCVIIKFRKLTINELLEIGKKGLIYLSNKHKLKVRGSPEQFKDALIKLAEYSDGSARSMLNKLYEIIETGTLTPESVIKSIPPDISNEIIEMTLKDNLEEAIERLESVYVTGNLDARYTVKRLLNAINNIEDRDLKIFAFSRLATTNHRIVTLQGDPLIEIIGFLADLWIAKYARR